MFIVYGLFSDDKIFYVGKTTADRLNRRLMEHKSRATRQSTVRNNQKIYNKIRKLVREDKNIEIKVLFETNLEEEQTAKEIELIEFYGRDIRTGGMLYNSTDGGEGVTGVIFSDDAKQKMSAAKKGNKLNLGRTRPDMVERFSKPLYVYDDNGILIREYQSQRKAAIDMGVSFKVINSSLKRNGRCWIEKWGKFIRCSLIKAEHLNEFQKRVTGRKVGQFSLTDEFIAMYDNISQATSALGKTRSNVNDCCRGRQKTAHGFIWKYITN